MADQVDEIKQKIDIVALLSEYIELKKAGRNYKALCPFHSEKTPSFMVSPELQIFKCFGCGESGDVISFLQKYEGMDFYEALKFLARRVGVTLRPFKGRNLGEKENLYKINSLAAFFYHYVLLKHPKGKVAIDYLLRERGLKLDTIKTFQLGYSPNVPFAAKSFLVDKHKIPIKDLERVGLIYTKEGQSIDRFRGRVIFPLSDHRGNIVGFAGRIIPGGETEDVAKYINTPETEIYHKSRLLYGLNLTKAEIKKEKSAILVEGELDLISSWQAGIKNIVAIKGSSLTNEQVSLLKRYTDSLILALDSDLAGDAAARRGIEIAESEGFELRVVKLKGFKDPDEAVRKDPENFKKAIREAIGVWDFIIESVFERFRGGDGLRKAKISKELIPQLAKIKDRIVQAHYAEKVARKLEVPVEAVLEQVKKEGSYSKTFLETEAVEVQRPIPKKRRELLEERLLALAFRLNPKTLLKRKVLRLFSSPFAVKLLSELSSYAKKHKDFDPSLFAASLPGELVDGFIDIILKDLKGLEEEIPENLEREITLVEKEINILNVKERLKDCAKKIRELERQKDKKSELSLAQSEFGRLTKVLNELETGKFKGIIL